MHKADEVDMPGLVKGGKWVYGWVTINGNGTIVIPPEVRHDYGFEHRDELVALPGSKMSGGFALVRSQELERSPLGRTRNLPTFTIDKNWLLRLTDDFLIKVGIEHKARLLLVRGSDLALGFVAKGPIFEEALKHAKLSSYS